MSAAGLHPEHEPIPGLGTCRNDVRLTAELVLDVLGVNYPEKKGFDVALVFEHGLANVRWTLALVISSLENRFENTGTDLSNEVYTLLTLENTLRLLSEGAPTLARILATDPGREES